MNYHPARSRENTNLSSLCKKRRSTMKKNKECHKSMRNIMIIIKYMQAKKDVQSVVIHNIQRDSDVQLASTNVEIATSMVISVACATRREKHMIRKGLWSQNHPKHINFRLVQFTHKIPYAASQKIYPQTMIFSACSYNSNVHKLRPRSQHHKILLRI